MAENEVPKVQTQVSALDWTVSAIRAWHRAFGSYPSAKQIAVLYGQWMFETGGKAFWNWNIGNVKHVDGDGYDWFDLPGTWEIINGVKVILPEGDKGRRFRNYKSLDDGMTHHLQFLRNKRYQIAWPYVESGNPKEFVFALKRQGYFTGDEHAYARGVEAYANRFLTSDTFEKASKIAGAVGKASSSVALPAPSAEASGTQSGISSSERDVDKVAIDLARHIALLGIRPTAVFAEKVRAFQAAHGKLVIDGAYGPKTASALSAQLLHIAKGI